MLGNIYQDFLYFLYLTLTGEVLWVVFPLFIATIIMLFYFEKYRNEEPGWNTHVANSLVLLFVSMTLFRYIYGLENLGEINFIIHLNKFVVSLASLFLGILILFLNFYHFLPEKLARLVSSPLNINLIAYMSILYVFSDESLVVREIVSLFLLFIFYLITFNLIRILIRKLFIYIKKMKEKEKIENLFNSNKKFSEKKKQIRKEELGIKKIKREVEKKERQEQNRNLKNLDKKKKETIRLKRIAKR